MYDMANTRFSTRDRRKETDRGGRETERGGVRAGREKRERARGDPGGGGVM